MEVKFVSKLRVFNRVLPFPNNYRRSNGTAKVVYPLLGERNEPYLAQYDAKEEKNILIGHIDTSISEFKEGDFVNFLELDNPEDGISKKIVWNEKEWFAFIVNDDGKTVDKL